MRDSPALARTGDADSDFRVGAAEDILAVAVKVGDIHVIVLHHEAEMAVENVGLHGRAAAINILTHAHIVTLCRPARCRILALGIHMREIIPRTHVLRMPPCRRDQLRVKCQRRHHRKRRELSAEAGEKGRLPAPGIDRIPGVHRIEDHALLSRIAAGTVHQFQRLLLQRSRVAVRILHLSGECRSHGQQGARNEGGTP